MREYCSELSRFYFLFPDLGLKDSFEADFNASRHKKKLQSDHKSHSDVNPMITVIEQISSVSFSEPLSNFFQVHFSKLDSFLSS